MMNITVDVIVLLTTVCPAGQVALYLRRLGQHGMVARRMDLDPLYFIKKRILRTHSFAMPFRSQYLSSVTRMP